MSPQPGGTSYRAAPAVRSNTGGYALTGGGGVPRPSHCGSTRGSVVTVRIRSAVAAHGSTEDGYPRRRVPSPRHSAFVVRGLVSRAPAPRRHRTPRRLRWQPRTNMQRRWQTAATCEACCVWIRVGACPVCAAANPSPTSRGGPGAHAPTSWPHRWATVPRGCIFPLAVRPPWARRRPTTVRDPLPLPPHCVL